MTSGDPSAPLGKDSTWWQPSDNSGTPDLESTSGWLFRSEDDDTAEHYAGLRPEQSHAPSPTPPAQPETPAGAPSPASPDRPPAPAPMTPTSAFDDPTRVRPATPAQPPIDQPAWTPVPTAPQARSAAGSASTTATVWRSVGLGLVIGLLVLAVAGLALWLARPRSTIADPPPRPASTSASPVAPASETPSATEAATSEAPASQNPAAANDAENSAGWTFTIDGLGPVKVTMKATDATKLGVIAPSADACEYAPTAVLGDVKVYAVDGQVHSVDIRSPKFPSGRGIRVGTSLTELKDLYATSLKTVTARDGDLPISAYALLNKTQYIAYLTEADAVSRIVIGRRLADGAIVLPPPC